MRNYQPILGLLMLTLAACGPSATDSATHFITSAEAAPVSAEVDTDGVARDDYGRPFTYSFLGKPLPAFKGDSVTGQPIDSSRFDKWTIIDVWGIWCGDCMADSKYVAELARRAPDEDLNFLSLHVPANANRATTADMFGKYGSVEAYFEQSGLSYPTLVDTDASLRERLKIDWTPTYLLVSPDGIVRGFRTELSAAGATPVDDFLAAVNTVRAAEFAKANAIRERATLGPNGAVNLAGETVFTLDAMQAAFPEFLVLADREDTFGDPIPVFRILAPLAANDATPLFTVWPDWSRGQVLAVATRNPAVKGPAGLTVGETRLSEIFPDTKTGAGQSRDENCTRSTLSGLPMFACHLPDGSENFMISFPADTESADDSVLFEMTFLPPSPAK